jgi:uncharacterized membrane protein YphA (DoxX/SURF4 family)
MKPVRAAARAMLSGIFVISGARALSNPDPLVGRAKTVTDHVGPLLERAPGRISTDPRTLVRVAGGVQFVGGLLLATGHLTRPAAAALAGTLVPTTLAAHPFWKMTDPAERAGIRVHFLKNLGLLGGLLLAAVDTEGKPGVGWRTRHAVDDGRRTVRRAVRTARRDVRIARKSAATARRIPG